MRLDPPSPHVVSAGAASKSPPLFRAESTTVSFLAEKDGKLRVRSSSLGDEAKMVHPGDVMEFAWGPQGVEARIVPALRRGEDLAAAIERASDPYDGDPAAVAKLQHTAVELINPVLLYKDTEPTPTRTVAELIAGISDGSLPLLVTEPLPVSQVSEVSDPAPEPETPSAVTPPYKESSHSSTK